MVIISAFGDEIATELEKQLEVLREEEIDRIDPRGINGKNVLDHSDEELQQVRQVLDQYGVRVGMIGSGIGKIKITDPFEPHLERFRRAIAAAHILGTPYIRLFSYYIPEGDEPAKWRADVMRRMEAKVKIAEQEKVILMHENERGIYGDNGERCLDIVRTIDSPHLRAVLDPANYVICGVRPYDEAYVLLADYVDAMHIKDARAADKTVVPSGEGDGQMREIFADLKKRGFSGLMTLEPHLKKAGQFTGFTGPDLFRVAAQALKKLLEETGFEYHRAPK